MANLTHIKILSKTDFGMLHTWSIYIQCTSTTFIFHTQNKSDFILPHTLP